MVEQCGGLDEVLEVLSHERRREVLRVLLTRNVNDGEDVLVIDEVVESERMKLELWHRHLPKLEEADLVVWDSESGRIWEGDQLALVEPFLEELEPYESGSTDLTYK